MKLQIRNAHPVMSAFVMRTALEMLSIAGRSGLILGIFQFGFGENDEQRITGFGKPEVAAAFH